jgi:hypothetical protein
MWDSLTEECEMEEENRFGLISHCTKVIGRITKQMEEVDLFIQTVMFMKANGEMIRHMDRVFTTIMMVQATMDSGLRMFKRDLALRNGPMDHRIKGNCLVYA